MSVPRAYPVLRACEGDRRHDLVIGACANCGGVWGAERCWLQLDKCVFCGSRRARPPTSDEEAAWRLGADSLTGAWHPEGRKNVRRVDGGVNVG